MANDTLELNIKAGFCGCGCRQPVMRDKATFLPGHDAKLKGILARHIAQPGVRFQNAHVRVTDGVGERDYNVEEFMSRYLSDKLSTKVHDMVGNLLAKDAEKRQRAADREARKAAAKEAKPAPVKTINAKVGRWIKSGTLDGDTFHYVDSQGEMQSTTKFTQI